MGMAFKFLLFTGLVVTLIGQSHQASANRWRATSGNIYYDERNHWDIQYGNNNRGTRDVADPQQQQRDERNALILLREITPFLPPEMINFYNELTDREKYVLKEFFQQDFESYDEILDFLWSRSEKLYNKTIEIRDLTRAKFLALSDDAKGFAIQLLREIRELKSTPEPGPTFLDFINKVEALIERYGSLDEEDKESLKTNFPMIAGIIQNEKFQELATAVAREWRKKHGMAIEQDG